MEKNILYRNPLDQIISLFNKYSKEDMTTLSINELITSYTINCAMQFNNIKILKKIRILFFPMKNSKKIFLIWWKKLCFFFEYEFYETLLKDAINENSISAIKEKERKGDNLVGLFSKSHIHSGSIGQWKHTFSS